MNSALMILTFDDVVNPATFVAQEITLLETDSFSTSQPENRFRFTRGNSPSPNGFTVNFTIIDGDLNQIKMKDQLATSINDTFVSISALVIMDTGGLAAMFGHIQACEYIVDTTPPFLISWTYNEEAGALSLLFSEAVNISSLDPSGITLLNTNSAATATQRFTLTGGMSFPNYTEVTFELFLTFEDLSAIQELTNLATSPNDSFIALSTGSIYDMFGNSVVDIPLTNAQQALAHDPDMRPPRLEFFTFDLDEGLLVLTFSESVNITSLNASQFTLANGNSIFLPSYVEYSLTGGMAFVNDTNLGTNIGIANHDVVVRLELTEDDLNTIKAETMLATDRFNTRLFFSEGAVHDAAGNAISAVDASESFVSLGFTPDTTEPELDSFSVDLNIGIISLTFTETVDVDSINFTGIAVINHNINTTVMYQLTGGETTTGDGTVISFIMDRNDINILKTFDNVFTRRRDSYIILDSFAISDNSGNPVLPLQPIVAVQASSVTQDTTSPELEFSELDMDSGNLTLSFSESVL